MNHETLHGIACRAGLLCALAWAGGSRAETPQEQARASAVSMIEAWAGQEYTLPDDLVLDPALRDAARALGDEQKSRALRLAATWADDEWAQQAGTASRSAVMGAVLSRYLNAIARWQLDTTGEDFDRVMLRAWQDPGLCRLLEGRTTFIGMLSTLQRMNTADRALALQAQRTMLARWGNAEPPARPVPALVEQAVEALRALRGLERAVGEPPVPPVLAWSQLQPKPVEPDRSLVCPLVVWALARPAVASLSPAERAVRARYAQLQNAVDVLQVPPNAKPGGYPLQAQRAGAEGKVKVEGRARADGKGMDAPRVVQRLITVPGIRDVRPVAFETILDRGSLERAAAVDTSKQAPGSVVEVEFVWRLQ